MNTIERAKVLAGRLPDPTRDDEMVVNEPAVEARRPRRADADLPRLLAGRLHGDPTAATTPLPDDQLHGPVVKMKIVGVVRMPIDSVLTFAAEPELYPSPGFYAQHHDQMAIYFTNGFVRLRHGAADLPAFQAHLAQVYGRADIPVKDLSDDVKRVQNSTDVERTALSSSPRPPRWRRSSSSARPSSARPRPSPTPSRCSAPWASTRRRWSTGLALPHVLAVATAVVSAVVTTYVLSARFPIGLARQLDPDLGYHLEPGYLLAAVVVALVVTAGMAVGASWLTTRAALRRGRVRRTGWWARRRGPGHRCRRPWGPAWPSSRREGAGARSPCARRSRPRPRRCSASWPRRPWSAGINDALHDPARSGRTWKLEAEPTAWTRSSTRRRWPGWRTWPSSPASRPRSRARTSPSTPSTS